MEKATEAEALRFEYLDLLKTNYKTSLTGLNRAKGLMAGNLAALLVTQSALVGALFLVDEGAVTILALVVAVALWWFWKCSKELKKHEAVKREYEEMDTRLKSIERQYFALTGTEIREALSKTEVYETFHELFKQRGIHLKQPNE
jgi:hypothetical protein